MGERVRTPLRPLEYVEVFRGRAGRVWVEGDADPSGQAVSLRVNGEWRGDCRAAGVLTVGDCGAETVVEVQQASRGFANPALACVTEVLNP